MHDKMMNALGSNADETWARKMIDHHRGSIKAGQILVSSGRDPQVQQIARNSATKQHKEISKRDGYRKSSDLLPVASRAVA